MRPVLSIAISLGLFLSAGFLLAAEKPNPKGILGAESYALYSAIYRDSAAGLAPDEILGIAAKPFRLPVTADCITPSTAEEREMAQAATAQTVSQTQWKRRFDFGRIYKLIPESEITQAIDCITAARRETGGATGCEQFRNMRYVRFLSVPVFNRDHTRALVAMSRACGGLCGGGSVRVYRRTSNGWKIEKDSFAHCFWVA